MKKKIESPYYHFIMNKEPPDKYRTLKIPLKRIVKNPKTQAALYATVERVNRLTIHLYQFLRLWMIYKYELDGKLPVVTLGTIKMANRALVVTDGIPGPKPSGENAVMFTEFEHFYRDHYAHLGYRHKIKATNLSQIIKYLSVSVLTSIENNIQANFIGCLKRYIKGVWDDGEKKTPDQRKLLKSQLTVVRNDLLEGTLKCDPKYHQWIAQNRQVLLPTLGKINKGHYYNLKVNPQQYLPGMFRMNGELCRLQKKMFQVFPLRSSVIPKYVPFDTHSLIDLLTSGNKRELVNNVQANQPKIWGGLFKLKHPIFKGKNWQFDYRLSTDGLAASLLFINKQYVDQQQQQKDQLKDARKAAREQLEVKKFKIIGWRLRDVPETAKPAKPTKPAKPAKPPVSQKRDEWTDLESLSQEELESVRKSGYLVADPGKDNLLYLSDGDQHLRFSNSEKLYLTGQLDMRKKLERLRGEHGIIASESRLRDVSGKWVEYGQFIKYISLKNEVNRELRELYGQEIFRRFRWYRYINRERYFEGVKRRIREKFGDKKPIFYGDYQCNRHLKGVIPCPGIGLKRRVAGAFKIFDLDEFRTSCLGHKREERCGNLRVTGKDGKVRKLHSVLTITSENGRYGCINRDLNAVRNMRKIVQEWLAIGERPLRFRRGVEVV